jgi:peptidoglycan/LPS O-acetylase OafA/YrhL
MWRTWDLHHQWFNRVVPGLLFGSRTDVRLDALLFGCLAALVMDDPVMRAGFKRRFRSWMWWMLVAAYLAVQAIYFIERSRTYSAFESALLALIVAGTVYGDQTRVYAFLEWEPMKGVGRLSYSLYLWQQLFLLPQQKSSMAVLQQFPVGLGMLFLFAWLSYRFVERPFIRLGHKLAPPPTQGRDDLARNAAVESLPAPAEVAREMIAS